MVTGSRHFRANLYSSVLTCMGEEVGTLDFQRQVKFNILELVPQGIIAAILVGFESTIFI